MSNLQVKDLPEDLHEELRRRALERHMTVRDYVLDLIRRDQARPTKLQWLARLHDLRAITADTPAAEAVRIMRDDRDRRADRA